MRPAKTVVFWVKTKSLRDHFNYIKLFREKFIFTNLVKVAISCYDGVNYPGIFNIKFDQLWGG